MTDDIKQEPESPQGDFEEEIKHEEDEDLSVPEDSDVVKEEDIVDSDPDRDAKRMKVDKLKILCDAKERDSIAALALSKHGLVDDDVRQQAWPLLLGYDPSIIKTELEDAKVKIEDGRVLLQDYLGRRPYTELPPHRDEEQVQLDVNRSFVYYPSGERASWHP
ncbi:hypothetical protein ABW21_db0207625 [Orbilia brochopaga]|nr:hypothetical protein ABW21_db0207625 [Drechslerella brochopaga]